jgi:hypothetical protein
MLNSLSARHRIILDQSSGNNVINSFGSVVAEVILETETSFMPPTQLTEQVDYTSEALEL